VVSEILLFATRNSAIHIIIIIKSWPFLCGQRALQMPYFQNATGGWSGGHGDWW
jgi:hypothetical protein